MKVTKKPAGVPLHHSIRSGLGKHSPTGYTKAPELATGAFGEFQSRNTI